MAAKVVYCYINIQYYIATKLNFTKHNFNLLPRQINNSKNEQERSFLRLQRTFFFKLIWQAINYNNENTFLNVGEQNKFLV